MERISILGVLVVVAIHTKNPPLRWVSLVFRPDSPVVHVVVGSMNQGE